MEVRLGQLYRPRELGSVGHDLSARTSAEGFSTNVQEIAQEWLSFVERKIDHLADDKREALW